MGGVSEESFSVKERYIDEGPTTFPPAPERKMMLVFEADVAEFEAGKCRNPDTVPLGPFSTFMERGLTTEEVLGALGARESLR